MKRKLDLNPGEDATQGHFDMRPRKVRRWVAQLPTANLSELARRLHEALTQVTAQQNTTRQLFHFLEAVGPAAALVFPHLARQYASQPLPLNDAGARASNTAVEIRAGLLMGYRHVLRSIVPEKEESSPLRIFWYRRELITVLHRFIHYGDGLLEIYRLLHMDPPEGLWRRIHRCYRLADKHKIAPRQVRLFGEKGRKSSIEHAYKRLLLSSLLPTGAIVPAQQKEIDVTFDQWVRLVKLRGTEQGHEGIQYLTRLARDHGPMSLEEAGAEALTSENSCLLDTRLLCAAIAQRRERGGKGRWWRREPGLLPETLALLHEHWCTVHKRAEARIAIDVPAEVAVGLSAVYYLAGGRPAAAPAAPRRAASMVVREDRVEGGQWLGKTEGADVWKTIYGNSDRVKGVQSPLPSSASAPLQHGVTEYSTIPGRLVDMSEHGLSVVIARSELRQAAIGMPAAVRTEGTDWIIGPIMRLKDRGDAVELGMKRLLNGAAPARLRMREGVRVSPPFDVVIGTTQDGRRAVAVPAVTALRSGDPDLELNGKTLPVGRGPNLIQSRYLDAFVIEVSSSETHTAIELAIKSAAEAPRQATGNAAAGEAPPTALEGDAHEERIRKLMEETGLARSDAEFIVASESASGGPQGS